MSDGISLNVTGAAELARALKAAGEKATLALAAAMVNEMEAVMADAKRLTPVDTGILRASGTVNPPKIDGTKIDVAAGFGGAASAYAVPVHEKLGVHHPSGQAKFLEQPLLEHSATIGEALAEGVRKALERL